jgi:hypothetical protein
MADWPAVDTTLAAARQARADALAAAARGTTVNLVSGDQVNADTFKTVKPSSIDG